MYLSTSNILMHDSYTDTPIESFGRCFDLLSSSGFDSVDVNFWGLSKPDKWFSSDGWEDTVLKIGEMATERGLSVHQTHATNCSGSQWDDPNYPFHEFDKKMNLRIIRATAMIGGRCVVMHPMSLPHDPMYDRRRLKDAALKMLEPYVEEAKKYGVSIAVENMVDFRGSRRRYCGGDVFELIELVDAVNDPDVGICVDTGHANVSGLDAAAVIREVGKRLKATHINDNKGKFEDEHLLPFFGTVNWESTVRALKDIGYEGAFDFEVEPKRCPIGFHADLVEYSAKLGRYLMSL